MGVIVLEPAAKGEGCACCGEQAGIGLRFQGPGANKRAKLKLCSKCKTLLGAMLVESEPTVKPQMLA